MLNANRPRVRSNRKPKCPICSKPAEADYKPFCSERCRQVDLNRWLGEAYRIPSSEPAGPEEDQ